MAVRLGHIDGANTYRMLLKQRRRVRWRDCYVTSRAASFFQTFTSLCNILFRCADSFSLLSVRYSGRAQIYAYRRSYVRGGARIE